MRRRGLPLQLVVPKVTSVEEGRLVGDVLLQGVGQRQAGQEAFGCVGDGRVEDLRRAEDCQAPPPPRLPPLTITVPPAEEL